MLTVYKASAGSGKTFRLVTEYIRLLLQNERSYRHILAVTFTNKATAEMKERVVEQLSKLANRENTPYKDVLIKETGLLEDSMAMKAQAALTNILFDYNRFAVSTIDKFTQKIIKGFNREVGITPDFQLELDSDLIIDESVDRMVSEIDQNPELRKWLERFIEEKIRNNQNFSVEKDLKTQGMELFKEHVQGMLPQLTKFFSDPEIAGIYLQILDNSIFGFEAHLKNKANEIKKIYTLLGYSSADFAHKSGGVAGFIEKIASGNKPDEFGQRILDAASSSDKWVTKNGGRTELIALVESDLRPRLIDLIEYLRRQSVNYYTAKAIKKEWFTLSVLLDLNSEILKLNREKGILPIASSNMLLRSIIDGNDTPFIYEKTGNTYHHFMLDEFQDTSAMQWENFKPLIGNALAMGASNLTVGDVKQSIYRWRNSTWNILASEIYRDFKGFQLKTITLDKNYRSNKQIVGFNNEFFKSLVEKMAEIETIRPVIEIYKPILEGIYADMEQKSDNQDDGVGYVRVEVLGGEDESFPELALQRLAEQVKQLQDNGFRAFEIAILVRKNTHGEDIVNFFLEIAQKPENIPYNLKVLSSESLFLRSSPGVNFVVTVIRHILNKEEKLFKAVLLHLYEIICREKEGETEQQTQLGAIPQSAWYIDTDIDVRFEKQIKPIIDQVEKEIIISSTDEIIIRICGIFGLFGVKSALPYLQALIDKTAEIRKRMTNDLSNFLIWWDEKGNKESVKISEEIDAVRLLTVHKSKGLEFKAVLVPFVNWKLNENKNFIWCSPAVPPFSQAPLVPLKLESMLEKTIFADEYYREYFNIVVDNLNLVYVAFTRAKSVLMFNLPEKNNRDTIGAYVLKTVNDLAQKGLISQNENIFESGVIPRLSRVDNKMQQKPEYVWHFSPFGSQLKLRTENVEFVDLTERGNTRKNIGKTIHSILSSIETSADVDKAIGKAELAGNLRPMEMETVKQNLVAMMGHPVAGKWFDGSYRIMNEKTILAPGDIYRPDRIMVGSNQAIVVDFKTGIEKRASHKTQVEEYCRALSGTGMANVKGYLVYLHYQEVDEVQPMAFY